MKLLSVFLLFLITSCGNPQGVIDPELLPYVHRFEHDFGFNIGPIDMNFTDLTDNVSGTCYPNFEVPRISVDRWFWNHDSDFGKEETIYHELGHCVFGLGHNEREHRTWDDYLIPDSIMYPASFGNIWYYQMYRQDYINEMKRSAGLL